MVNGYGSHSAALGCYPGTLSDLELPCLAPGVCGLISSDQVPHPQVHTVFSFGSDLIHTFWRGQHVCGPKKAPKCAASFSRVSGAPSSPTGLRWSCLLIPVVILVT